MLAKAETFAAKTPRAPGCQNRLRERAAQRLSEDIEKVRRRTKIAVPEGGTDEGSTNFTFAGIDHLACIQSYGSFARRIPCAKTNCHEVRQNLAIRSCTSKHAHLSAAGERGRTC